MSWCDEGYSRQRNWVAFIVLVRCSDKGDQRFATLGSPLVPALWSLLDLANLICRNKPM